MKLDIDLSRNYNRDRLLKYLNFEISTGLLFFISLFWGISFLLLGIAALIFLPILLKILFEERKFGWIIFFILYVAVPSVLMFIIGNKSNNQIYYMMVIGLFYSYFFFLKIAANQWE